MKFNSRTITITTDAEVNFCTPSSDSITRYNKERTQARAEALAVLVGGEYNKYARGVDTKEVEVLQNELENLIYKMDKLIKENK